MMELLLRGAERRSNPPDANGGLLLSNGKLGMMLLVGTETILFASFISMYLVLRMAAPSWPPAGTPHLTLGLSSINVAVILLSAIALATRSRLGSNLCLLLGSVFLGLQAVEFHSLYARGLTLKTGPYGAIFFTLASAHGLHVLGGLGFLAFKNRYSGMYWYFVTVVWFVLFAILYLA